MIDLILSEAQFKEVPYQPEASETEAVDWSAAGHEESDIPEAKPEGAGSRAGDRRGRARKRVSSVSISG